MRRNETKGRPDSGDIGKKRLKQERKRRPTSYIPPSHYHLPSSGQNLTGAFTSLSLHLGGSDAARVAAGVAKVTAGVAAGVADGGWLIMILKIPLDDKVVALIISPKTGVIVGVTVGVVAGVART